MARYSAQMIHRTQHIFNAMELRTIIKYSIVVKFVYPRKKMSMFVPIIFYGQMWTIDWFHQI